jgi:putative hemolysin
LAAPSAIESPLELPVLFKSRFGRLLFSKVKRSIEKALYLRALDAVYREVCHIEGMMDFLAAGFDALGVKYEAPADHLKRIPGEGPLIVVANHPYGGLEGLILIHLLRSVRPDAKVLANYILHRFPQVQDALILVDPFGGNSAKTFNLAPLRESVIWVRNGGALGVFPAGQVSSVDLTTGLIRDRQWQSPVARLIRITQAPVLPLFFEGSNDFVFQLAGLVHPRVRTAMLPRAMVKSRGKSVGVRIGDVIPFSRLNEFANDDDLLGYLRMRTYILSADAWRRKAEKRTSFRLRRRSHKPVVSPVDPACIVRELESVPPEQMVSAGGDFEVWWVEAGQAHEILQEIGRLREVTFRAAGEGTGKPIDIDHFDSYYLHLFLWDKKERRIAGAYRLGQTDRILPRFGVKGLYTNTLYKFSKSLIGGLGCAVELGRSFIRPEYQKQHSPLALLWRGIGAFVVANPQYKTLFGPVSISNEYETVSRQMMIAFLKVHAHLPNLAKHAKPRKPAKASPKRSEVQHYGQLVSDINEVSSMVADLESDQKGVPVLLRQYLRLNAKFISCNVDPHFGGVWDGLMIVDLTQTDRRILDRYLGKEAAAQYLAYHREKARLVG